MNNVKNGNLDSMRILFERYNKRIFCYFLQNTNRNRDLSADLTQNVFYRIIQYKKNYDNKHLFVTWIFGIARNILIDYWHKNKLQTDLIDENTAYESTDLIDLETREAKEHLYEAMDKLSPEYREIIVLAKLDELKYEQIAEITGISAGAVKVKVFRAISKLREIYFSK